MALFAPLEDALVHGALGNLPGASTVDLTNVATNFNCCCTIFAEPQQWQFEQQLFIIDLLRGLT